MNNTLCTRCAQWVEPDHACRTLEDVIRLRQDNPAATGTWPTLPLRFGAGHDSKRSAVLKRYRAPS